MTATNFSHFSSDIQMPNMLTEEQASVKRTIAISIACSVTIFGVLVAILVTIITCVTCQLKLEQNKRKYETEKTKNEAILQESQNRVTELNRQASLERHWIDHKAEIELHHADKKHELAVLQTERKHEINKQLLSMYATEMSKVGHGWKIVYSIDDHNIELSIEKKDNANCEKKMPCIVENESSIESSDIEMVDGPEPVHSMYNAQALNRSRRPRLQRGNSIDVESKDNRLEKAIMEDCVQTIMKASLKDAILGPTLRQIVSTE